MISGYRLWLMVIVVSLLGGCMTFYDPRPVVKQTNQLILSKAAKVAWVWHPSTERSNAKGYQIALANNIKNLQLKRSLPLVDIDQVAMINRGILKAMGGIYDPKNGQQDQLKIKRYHQLLSQKITQQWPEVEYVMMIEFVSESTRIENGRAQWRNTEQRITDLDHFSSTDNRSVVTIEVRYIALHSTKELTLNQGLDMISPPTQLKVNRYDDIIDYLFEPFSINQ